MLASLLPSPSPQISPRCFVAAWYCLLIQHTLVFEEPPMPAGPDLPFRYARFRATFANLAKMWRDSTPPLGEVKTTAAKCKAGSQSSWPVPACCQEERGNQSQRSESAHLVCFEGKWRGHDLGHCGKGIVKLTIPPLC